MPSSHRAASSILFSAITAASRRAVSAQLALMSQAEINELIQTANLQMAAQVNALGQEAQVEFLQAAGMGDLLRPGEKLQPLVEVAAMRASKRLQEEGRFAQEDHLVTLMGAPAAAIYVSRYLGMPVDLEAVACNSNHDLARGDGAEPG